MRALDDLIKTDEFLRELRQAEAHLLRAFDVVTGTPSDERHAPRERDARSTLLGIQRLLFSIEMHRVSNKVDALAARLEELR